MVEHALRESKLNMKEAIELSKKQEEADKVKNEEEEKNDF